MNKKETKQRVTELNKIIAATKKEVKKELKQYNASAKKVIDVAHECSDAQHAYNEKATGKNQKKLQNAQTAVAAQYKDYAAIGAKLSASLSAISASYSEIAAISKAKKSAQALAECRDYIDECTAAVADVQQEVAKMVAVKGADGTIQQPSIVESSAFVPAAPALPTRTVSEIEASIKNAKKEFKTAIKQYQRCEKKVVTATEGYKAAQAAYENKNSSKNAKKFDNAKATLSSEYKEYAVLKAGIAQTLETVKADYNDLALLNKPKRAGKYAAECSAYINECNAAVAVVDEAIAKVVVVKAA